MKLRQPEWTRVLPSSVVVNVATLGPLGRFKAPGTVGSLAGIVAYTIFFQGAYPAVVFLWTVALLYLAFAFCGEAEVRLQKVDPGEVILDEFAAMPLCFFGVTPFMHPPKAWQVYIAGFLIFRFFDILKPLGIKRLQRFPGGFGVVVDDVAAALATCICLNLLFWLTPLRYL